MDINGIRHNYDYLGTMANYTQGKTAVKEVISKTVKQPENLSISNEGRAMLRAMRSVSSLTLKKEIIMRKM